MHSYVPIFLSFCGKSGHLVTGTKEILGLTLVPIEKNINFNCFSDLQALEK